MKISGRYLLVGLVLIGIIGYVGYRLFAPFEPEPTPTPSPTPIQLMSFEESVEFAVNGSYIMAGKWDFSEYRWLGEYEGESFVTMDGLEVGYFEWRNSNGTLYEVWFPATQYPQGKVLHIEVPDDVEEYNIWEITTEENVCYIDARNGIIRLIME